jgi:hypothetical protein
MKHISYPSIGQFRNCIKSITDFTRYAGKDENGDAIYDGSRPLPIITFVGTTKAHGTNSAVCFNNNDGLWCQSRERVLSIQSDNMGFYSWANGRQDWFIKTINEISLENNIDLSIYTISIYGEFCGNGIQSGVAISKIDKSMLIFGIKISKINDLDFSSYWIPVIIKSSPKDNIFNINDFGAWRIDIDFNNPQLSINQIVKWVEEVENCCPIGKFFGVDGIGEGIVWQDINLKYLFKTKGEKHSVSRVKSLVSVDTEKLESINDFVKMVVTDNRVNQFIQQVFGGKDNFQPEKIGDFLRAFNNDVIKEEEDALIANSLSWKDVSGAVSRQAKIVLFRNVV